MKNILLNEKNMGLMPGTPVYVGDRPASAMGVSVLTFAPSFADFNNVPNIDDLPLNKKGVITWVNINGLNDIDSIKKLANIYNIHLLTLEDILNTKQQPKVEIFEDYGFMSFKSIKGEFQDNDRDEFQIDQISMVIKKGLLITFQEAPDDPFDGIRKRIMDNSGQIRKMGLDYLAYLLVNAVADEYCYALAKMEDVIEDLEDRAVKTSNDKFISEIQNTKKRLFHIKRSILPLRENIIIMSRQNTRLIKDELKPFIQDLQENLSNAMETIENYRDWLSNIMEVNLSVLSYQMNKVMKILAIVSALFIPLTFIAGVYGMNFESMPELSQPWGYPVVLCVMGTVAASMVLFFKIRHWF